MSADADVDPAQSGAQGYCRGCGAPLPSPKRKCDACQKETRREIDRRKEARRKERTPPEKRLRPKGSPKIPRVRTYADRASEYERRRERKADKRAAYLARVEASRKLKEAKAAQVALEREAKRLRGHADRPWTSPTLSARERYAMRYRLDPEFNLRERLRSQVRDRRKTKRFEDGLRKALRGSTSGRILEAVLGYTMRQLRDSFERQFTKGMSWQRFTDGEIHIGHIVPLHRFDLNDPQEAVAAWAITNLRPEWAADNLKRGRAYDLLV